MTSQYFIGEIAALATALCWAVTATAFEKSAKRIGSLSLNLTRLLIGLLFLSVFTTLTRGQIFPFDASASTWFWLLLSGLVGVVIGDLFLFESFVLIGSRIAMLIYATVPPLSAVLAYLFLGEVMSMMQIIGMTITLLGISMVILVSKGEGQEKRIAFSHPVKGILFAFIGAFGQAAGYILGKFGLSSYDAFSATQIRLLAGIAGFAILFTLKGHWRTYFKSFKVKGAFVSLSIGSFFGPFLGISLSLYAVQNIHPGVASTLISITPILLVPYAHFVKKDKVSLRELMGTFIAFIGVILMFV